MSNVSVGAGPTAMKSAMTSFIGRRQSLAEARRSLSAARLVTLTGPGGVGKTRFSVELAHRAGKAFRDGVWFVELDGLEKEARVAPAVATRLSVPDQSNRAALDRVLDHLREKQLLLVLDNCEHVVQGTAELVSHLLAAAPQVRVLATSREPLGLVGEHIFTVPPLSTPPEDHVSTGKGIDHFESVALFVDRARGVVPDFRVTDTNRDAVAQLCTRLDGMPLAIELAATRLRSLTVTQLLDRLDQRFQLLNRGDRAALPRQQTLQSLIDWSYELCSEAERLLWRRLSIFSESFDLEAAERVCGFGDLDSGDVLDLLDQLVSKSIVNAERKGEELRYHQLMTIREYGSQLLDDAAERHELKRRHRDHYLDWVATRTDRWCGPGQAEFLDATRAERPNLMAALEWSLSAPGEEPVAAQLAVALRYHWIAGGFLSDGRAWLDRILTGGDLPRPARGNALWVAGWVCLMQGDHDAADAYLTECRQVAAELDDPVLMAHARHWTALHLLFIGDLEESIAQFREAIAGHGQAGDHGARLAALFMLAMAQTFAGANEEALHTCRAAVRESRELNERWSRAYSQWIIGICHWHLGDNAAARKAAERALRIQQDFQDGICTALTIELLSWVADTTGDFDRALELSGAAGCAWRVLGTRIKAFGPHIEETSRRSVERIRAALGPDCRPGRLDGPDLTKEQTIALALGTTSGRPVPVPRDHPLTDRELEIAELVSQGLTNRTIAEQLVLSPRTVDGHVERILTKLDFTSRTQVATWVESQRAVA